MRKEAALLLLLLLALAVPAGADDHRAKDRLRFLLFGDSGTGEPDQYRVGRRMAEECASRGGCDFALMLGDNFYGNGVKPPFVRDGRLVLDRRFTERFEAPYEPLGPLEFWAVAGNHDWSSTSVDAEIAYTRHSSRWRMPARDYAIPLLPDWIRIYGLDTTMLTQSRKRDQIERAKSALCGGGGWRLLMGHHPVYSSGWHGNSKGEYPKMIDPLLAPLIEACGIHLYLSGHDHHQEHLQAPAFDQIVQGAGGQLRDVQRIKQRPAGIEQLAAESLFGFALVEATPAHLEIRFFGYGRNHPYAAWHCRSYTLDDFADQERRSKSCDP